MPQIATWTVNGTDHVGERRTSGTFTQTATQMAREYEKSAGLAANSVIFTIRDASTADPRTSQVKDQVKDAAPAPDPEMTRIQTILDKDKSSRSATEKDDLLDFIARKAIQ